MCTLCALACPAQAASKERGPSKDLAPLLGGLWGLCAHPECFFPATSAWQMQNLSEGCFREQGLDWSIP